jgi:hypothetical protein
MVCLVFLPAGYNPFEKSPVVGNRQARVLPAKANLVIN